MRVQPIRVSNGVGLDKFAFSGEMGAVRSKELQRQATEDAGTIQGLNVLRAIDTERLIGDAAKNRVARNREDAVPDAKRPIDRKFTDSTVQSDTKLWYFEVEGQGDKPMTVANFQGEVKQFHPEEASLMTLFSSKESARAYLGSKTNDAVDTAPACFNAPLSQATKFADPIIQSDIKLWPFGDTGQGDEPMIDANAQGKENEFHPEAVSSTILCRTK